MLGAVEISAWVAVAPAVLLVQRHAGDGPALTLVGAAALALGLRTFWTHGRQRITATGVAGFAFATFCGFASLYHARHGAATSELVAVAVSTYLAVGLALLGQRRTTRAFRQVALEPMPLAMATRVRRLGVALLLVGLGANEVGASAGGMAEGAGWAGVALVAVSIIGQRRWSASPWRLVAATGALGAYVAVIFDGFGRLELVALMFAVAILSVQALPRRRLKALAILAFLPGLIVLGASRTGGGKSLVFDGQRDGLGSVVGPIATFAETVRQDTEPRWGQTFVATATLPVPRSLWGGKPDGFGRDLVLELQPERTHTGHSLAATWTGEWWWNFGWFGVAASAAVLGLALRVLDRRLARQLRVGLRTPSDLMGLLLVVVLVVGMADLLWAGSFTFVARSLGRFTAVAALWVWFRVLRPRRRPGAVRVGAARGDDDVHGALVGRLR